MRVERGHPQADVCWFRKGSFVNSEVFAALFSGFTNPVIDPSVAIGRVKAIKERLMHSMFYRDYRNNTPPPCRCQTTMNAPKR